MTFVELPFVKSNPDCGENGPAWLIWCVTPSGDYVADCLTGKAYFQALLAVATAETNIIQITSVLQALVTSTTVLSGIEIGFLQAVAEQAVGF